MWDEATLDKWLTDPDVFVPGNNMDFLVSKPQERKDLIAYLRKSSGKQNDRGPSFFRRDLRTRIDGGPVWGFARSCT